MLFCCVAYYTDSNFIIFINIILYLLNFIFLSFYVYIFIYLYFYILYFYIFIFLYFYIFIFLYFYIFIFLYFYIFIFLYFYIFIFLLTYLLGHYNLLQVLTSANLRRLISRAVAAWRQFFRIPSVVNILSTYLVQQ